MRRTALGLLLLAPLALRGEPDPAATFIPWLLRHGGELKNIPFSSVLEASSGRRIQPVDSNAAWLRTLEEVVTASIAALNDPSHPVHSAGRINEASRFIEDDLLARCNAVPGWTCRIPATSAGGEQRSGYPDLHLVLADGGHVYLDPKLFAAESRGSTLRTFYYEPKSTTGKVHHDACHLLVGISHNGGTGGRLRFEGYELVDVSKIRVQLKAEFQSSNRDLYAPANIVRSGAAP